MVLLPAPQIAGTACTVPAVVRARTTPASLSAPPLRLPCRLACSSATTNVLRVKLQTILKALFMTAPCAAWQLPGERCDAFLSAVRREGSDCTSLHTAS